jgi:hypothetical protein
VPAAVTAGAVPLASRLRGAPGISFGEGAGSGVPLQRKAPDQQHSLTDEPAGQVHPHCLSQLSTGSVNRT